MLGASQVSQVVEVRVEAGEVVVMVVSNLDQLFLMSQHLSPADEVYI